MERNTRNPPSSGPIAVEDDQAADESSHPISPLVTPGGFALSDFEKAKALQTILKLNFNL